MSYKLHLYICIMHCICTANAPTSPQEIQSPKSRALWRCLQSRSSSTGAARDLPLVASHRLESPFSADAGILDQIAAVTVCMKCCSHILHIKSDRLAGRPGPRMQWRRWCRAPSPSTGLSAASATSTSSPAPTMPPSPPPRCCLPTPPPSRRVQMCDDV